MYDNVALTPRYLLKLFDEYKIVSEYDQEIPQSQTADKRVASGGRDTQQSRDTINTNKANQLALSFLHQVDCKSRMDTKQRMTKQTEPPH